MYECIENHAVYRKSTLLETKKSHLVLRSCRICMQLQYIYVLFIANFLSPPNFFLSPNREKFRKGSEIKRERFIYLEAYIVLQMHINSHIHLHTHTHIHAYI